MFTGFGNKGHYGIQMDYTFEVIFVVSEQCAGHFQRNGWNDFDEKWHLYSAKKIAKMLVAKQHERLFVLNSRVAATSPPSTRFGLR